MRCRAVARRKASAADGIPVDAEVDVRQEDKTSAKLPGRRSRPPTNRWPTSASSATARFPPRKFSINCRRASAGRSTRRSCSATCASSPSRGWFVDVQPTYEQAPNGRIVIFKVVERPVVRYVEYLGNYGIRTKKLAKETDLKVGGPVDPYAVQEARRRMIDLYHRNGFNNVQISILEGDKPTDHGIVFVINEGTAQKIWKVEFVGNEFVSEQPAQDQDRFQAADR